MLSNASIGNSLFSVVVWKRVVVKNERNRYNLYVFGFAQQAAIAPVVIPEYSPAVTAALPVPTVDTDGIALSAIRSNVNSRATPRYTVFLDVGNTGSLEVHWWGYNGTNWFYTGPMFEPDTAGKLFSGAVRQRYMVLGLDAGMFTRVYAQALNVTATIAAVVSVGSLLDGHSHGRF